MTEKLRRAVAWPAYNAGVNLNYVFDPIHTWRLQPRQLLLLHSRR